MGEVRSERCLGGGEGRCVDASGGDGGEGCRGGEQCCVGVWGSEGVSWVSPVGQRAARVVGVVGAVGVHGVVQRGPEVREAAVRVRPARHQRRHPPQRPPRVRTTHLRLL